MPAVEREIAGLRCGEVLQHLSDFLDGELDADLKARVTEHVCNCDNCERFGGAFATTVRLLRQQVPAEDLPVLEPHHLQRISDHLGDLPGGA